MVPSAQKHNQAFENFEGHHIRIKGEKAGVVSNTKMFVSKWLYLTFESTLGGKIDLRPVFVDPEKANSLKYVIASNTNKFDKSNSGVDAPTVPPQKTMLASF